YLRIGSFANYSPTRKKMDSVYRIFKDSIGSQNLIVDLRNNGGGASQLGKPFKKIIKKLARKHKVYLLVNNKTVSAAEIFVIDLQGRKNILIAGERTAGMITYGNNTGKWLRI